MGGIGQKHYPAQLLLPPGGRPVQSLHFRVVQYCPDGIVITGIPSDIDRQYHFGMFIDCGFYLVRIDSKITITTLAPIFMAHKAVALYV